MKFTIQREDILPALQTVNGVVERRQTLPILSNLLISAGPDSMQLTATDMEVELVAHIRKSVKGATDVTLPARKLLDICRALPDGASLTLDIESDRATVGNENQAHTGTVSSQRSGLARTCMRRNMLQVRMHERTHAQRPVM